MGGRDFYVGSKPTKLGALLGERGQRGIVADLQRDYRIRRLLEIGTGKGRVARACRDFGVEYFGIDCSADVVEQAQADCFRMILAGVPPLPDLGGFKPDVVVSIDTLSNLTSYEQAQGFVASAGSCLDPGGLFLLMAPDLRFAKWSFWDPDLTRGFPTTRRRLARLLHEAGFDIVESSYQLDGIGQPWCFLIYYGTKLIPYRLLDTLTGWRSRRDLALYPSVWETIHHKAPGAYVLGRKRSNSV
jgi:SAM-dependent methyltransferase